MLHRAVSSPATLFPGSVLVVSTDAFSMIHVLKHYTTGLLVGVVVRSVNWIYKQHFLYFETPSLRCYSVEPNPTTGQAVPCDSFDAHGIGCPGYTDAYLRHVPDNFVAFNVLHIAHDQRKSLFVIPRDPDEHLKRGCYTAPSLILPEDINAFAVAGTAGCAVAYVSSGLSPPTPTRAVRSAGNFFKRIGEQVYFYNRDIVNDQIQIARVSHDGETHPVCDVALQRLADIAISPDGITMAILGTSKATINTLGPKPYSENFKNDELHLVTIATNHVQSVFALPRPYDRITFAPDGLTLAAVGYGYGTQEIKVTIIDME